jgi:predicted dehydrogenase
MVKVGIAGFGFMGQMHFRAYREVADAKVVAIFDVDSTIFQRGATQGNIASGDLGDLSAIAKFSDFDRFLAADLDAIDICTPTFLHRDLTERALASGRPVLCEKPMALSVADCDSMIVAAAKAGKHFMVAQCVRFWPGYDEIRDAVGTGKYGAPLAATFRRLGGAPAWSGWFLDEARSGGGLLDCLVHDFDFARAAFGLPESIQGRGTINALGPASGVSYSRSDLVYPQGPAAVTIEGGWAIGPTYPFSMTAFVQFEEATLAFGMEPGADLVIHHRRGEKEIPKLREGQGYAWELRHFLETLRDGRPPALCPPEESRDAIAMALAARESIATGRPVRLG